MLVLKYVLAILALHFGGPSHGVAAYGQPAALGPPLTVTSGDPFGFGGQYGNYTDGGTGLVLMTHREYDPAAGRFLTRDPLGYAGGIIQSMCCRSGTKATGETTPAACRPSAE